MENSSSASQSQSNLQQQQQPLPLVTEMENRGKKIQKNFPGNFFNRLKNF